jgi:hypothetical protein
MDRFRSLIAIFHPHLARIKVSSRLLDVADHSFGWTEEFESAQLTFISKHGCNRVNGTCLTIVLVVLPRLPNIDKALLHKSGNHHLRPYTSYLLYALLFLLKHRPRVLLSLEPAFMLGRQLVHIFEAPNQYGHPTQAARHPTSSNASAKIPVV